MNETILAYNLGYRVNKSGELYLGGVPINYICVVLCSNCHRKLHYYNLSIEELKDGRF